MATAGGVLDPLDSPVERSIEVEREDVLREEEVEPFESVDISVDVGIQYEPNICIHTQIHTSIDPYIHSAIHASIH
eukprot:1948330-Karenia_brevis.AAC.1